MACYFSCELYLYYYIYMFCATLITWGKNFIV